MLSNQRAILLKPLISEKSMSLIKNNLYTFAVDRNSSKEQIANLVSRKFNVDVLAVKTINIKGKVKMQRSRQGFYTTQNFKKAIVQIKKNQKIALFEVATEEEKAKNVEIKTADTPKVKEKKSLLGRTKVRIESGDSDQELAKKGAKSLAEE